MKNDPPEHKRTPYKSGYDRGAYKRPFGDRLPRDRTKTLLIIIIGTLIILGTHFIGKARDAVQLKRMQSIAAQTAQYNAYKASIDICAAPPLSIDEQLAFMDDGVLHGVLYGADVSLNDFAPALKPIPDAPIQPISGRGNIVVIIDDMGVDVKRSQRVMDLPANLTLAFLPYAPNVRPMSAAAKAQGHELLIHIPMEAVNSDIGLGGMGLRTRMSAADFDTRLTQILNSFGGYVGVNNHMGSKLTQSEPAMRKVMLALKKRDKFFVDSRTIHTSVAADIAKITGVDTAVRDVFLDHVDTPQGVRDALTKAEHIAKRDGTAIVIGHPKDNTINALTAWLPTLKNKGLKIIPAQAVVR